MDLTVFGARRRNTKSFEGIKVEVKSSAYLQSWSQKKLSTIQFGVRPTQVWDSKTNTYSSEFARQSDVYVFCVLQHKDQETIDPLNMDQWNFYVLATNKLNEAVGRQKTITLGSLRELDSDSAQLRALDKEIHETFNKYSFAIVCFLCFSRLFFLFICDNSRK